MTASIWGRSSSPRSSPLTGAKFPRSADAEVLELPGIAAVEMLVIELAAALQRGPLGLHCHHGAEIGPANTHDKFVVEILGLQQPLGGMFDQPHGAGEYRNGDLD